MNQDDIPIFFALKKHSLQSVQTFHVPGHKNGKLIPDFARSDFESILKLDATELTGLDDLHSPEGAIKEAQELAAKWYGVKESYFLVGGSTAGNLAMIMSACNGGDVVLVQRNCHKSIIHGLQIAGITPVFLSPFIDPRSQIPIGVTLKSVQEAIAKFSNVKALILTYPNYYGMAAHDLKEIIRSAHEKSIPVLVDEAHGAHFSLGAPFPVSSIEYGADIVIHSAHKTLPAMTMGAYAHFNSKLLNQQTLEYYLQVIQSSSPSYPIMASLDLARYYIAHMGENEIESLRQGIERIHGLLHHIPQISVLPHSSDDYVMDWLKITIQTRCHASGYEIQSLLEQHGIFTELADPYHVLFILQLGNLKEEYYIINKMKDILADIPLLRSGLEVIETHMQSNDTATLEIQYKEMRSLSKKKIPLHKAKGFVSAVNVIPYPPGVPILMMGEMITSEHITYIEYLRYQGARFQVEPDFWTSGVSVFV